MTPADKRVMDLLERWLKSIELHLKYADLDEHRYRQIQPWPAHERPARWVLELAQQKVLQLQTLFNARLSQNDAAFSESLELMGFLANLVGAQHIQRFVPLADPARENAATLETATVEIRPVAAKAAPPQPSAAEPAPRKPAAEPVTNRDADADRTREMPRLKPAKRSVAASPSPAHQAKTQETASHKPVAKSAPVKASAPAAKPAPGSRIDELVVADAVRLLRWGRQWHELAELIARMAERPTPSEVRRILRSHKAAIEAQLAN